MITVLLDTNVVLDALLEREPWAAAANEIFRANAKHKIVVARMLGALAPRLDQFRSGWALSA